MNISPLPRKSQLPSREQLRAAWTLVWTSVVLVLLKALRLGLRLGRWLGRHALPHWKNRWYIWGPWIIHTQARSLQVSLRVPFRRAAIIAIKQTQEDFPMKGLGAGPLDITRENGELLILTFATSEGWWAKSVPACITLYGKDAWGYCGPIPIQIIPDLTPHHDGLIAMIDRPPCRWTKVSLLRRELHKALALGGKNE